MTGTYLAITNYDPTTAVDHISLPEAVSSGVLA